MVIAETAGRMEGGGETYTCKTRRCARIIISRARARARGSGNACAGRGRVRPSPPPPPREAQMDPCG